MDNATSPLRRPSRRVYAVLATAALLVSLFAPARAFADDIPVWRTPADAIVVLSIGVTNDLPYAIVRDTAMKGHNTYCVTIGAHIGPLRVANIGPGGVLLSNGRLLAPVTTTD
jgi:hypothetical protein